jgi:hypothetical protein
VSLSGIRDYAPVSGVLRGMSQVLGLLDQVRWRVSGVPVVRTLILPWHLLIFSGVRILGLGVASVLIIL